MRVILPRALLDAVVIGAGAGVVLLNRDPEPNEIQAPVLGQIQFDLVATDGGAIVPGSIDVKVQIGAGSTESAMVAGVAGPGWDGAGSGTALVGTATRHVVLAPTSPLPSLAVVLVVTASTTLGAFGSFSYSFRVEDLIPPVLIAAQAVSATTVRVTFDEPVDPGSAGVEAWTIVPVDVPAWHAPPVSASVSGAGVELTFSEELSFGKRYKACVFGASDIYGNEAELLEVEFVAWSPAWPERRRFQLWELMPLAARRRDESGDARGFVEVWQDVVDVLLRLVDDWHQIYDPELAPEQFVDAMLVDLGNPFGFLGITDLNIKRRLARRLVSLYRLKGTKRAIIDAIFLFLDLEVEILVPHADGWILGKSLLGIDTVLGGTSSRYRYSFVVISPRALTAEERVLIRGVVDTFKPSHTHLIEIREPVQVVEPDHWELGRSRLGIETILH